MVIEMSPFAANALNSTGIQMIHKCADGMMMKNVILLQMVRKQFSSHLVLPTLLYTILYFRAGTAKLFSLSLGDNANIYYHF